MPPGIASADSSAGTVSSASTAAEWTGGGERAIVDLLRHLGLVDARSIVSGDLMVVDVSRRNRNFAALRSDGRQYLVKTAESPDRLASLAHEASVYARLASLQPAGVKHLVPMVAAGNGYLVLEWHHGSRNLREVHQGRTGFGRWPAAEVGRALASLHSIPLASGDQGRDGSSVRGAPPWVLSLDAVPLRILHELSMANHEHIRMIQAALGSAGLLHGVASGWDASCLCHNDVRWDNCVVFPVSGARRTRILSIVDWELASLSDPSWDVGCFFADYIAYWASSLVPSGAVEAESDLVGIPALAVEVMQPAISSFWGSYLRHRDAAVSRPELLVRAVQLMGVRLLQAALEQGQRNAQPTGVSVTLVQLGLNVLESPEESALCLLGLDPYA